MSKPYPRNWLFLLSLLLLPITTQAETTSVVTVSIYQFNEDRPVVPDDALVVRTGIPGVFVAYQDQARFRMVRTGKSQKKLTSILSGLNHNDAVIREPRALFDGKEIKVQP